MLVGNGKVGYKLANVGQYQIIEGLECLGKATGFCSLDYGE